VTLKKGPLLISITLLYGTAFDSLRPQYLFDVEEIFTFALESVIWDFNDTSLGSSQLSRTQNSIGTSPLRGSFTRKVSV
jgi:hypothetical protein